MRNVFGAVAVDCFRRGVCQPAETVAALMKKRRRKFGKTAALPLKKAKPQFYRFNARKSKMFYDRGSGILSLNPFVFLREG